MGSIGTSTVSAYSSDYQYYLNNAGGDERVAFQDWIYNNVSSTFDKGGKEYTILWQNGVFPKIISEATPEDPYRDFQLEVYAIRSDKSEDEEAVRKAKTMFIPDYGTGKGRRTFRWRLYK